jgi:hypothetical protein
MIEQVAQRKRLAVERQINTEHARDNVAHALYEVLVEGMEFGPCELPDAEDREWIRGAMAVPLQEATEAALRSLSHGMTRTMEQAPAGLLERFERSHRWQALGWE